MGSTAEIQQVMIVAGTRQNGGFFALMHRGEDKVRPILAGSEAQLEQRIASVGVGEFGMASDDATEMASSTIAALQRNLGNVETVADPAAHTSDALVDVAGDVVTRMQDLELAHNELLSLAYDDLLAKHKDTADLLKDQQDEIEVLTAERDKAQAAVDTAKAEIVALSAELDSTKKTVSDLEDRIAAMKDASPAIGDGSLTGEGANPPPDAPDPSQGNQTGADAAGAGGKEEKANG